MLRELVRQAGVSSMALYRHFADRDALLSELAVIGFAELGERMHAVDKVKDSSRSPPKKKWPSWRVGRSCMGSPRCS